LFDASAGGGGAVLPLVLSGSDRIDAPRIKLIIRILERALKICTDCTECNELELLHKVDVHKTPVSNEEFINLPNKEHPDKEQFRKRQSCYGCLKSYGNQLMQDKLDRKDAAVILEAILSAGGADKIQVEEPSAVPREPSDTGDASDGIPTLNVEQVLKQRKRLPDKFRFSGCDAVFLKWAPGEALPSKQQLTIITDGEGVGVGVLRTSLVGDHTKPSFQAYVRHGELPSLRYVAENENKMLNGILACAVLEKS
jgi:hypothetical protein